MWANQDINVAIVMPKTRQNQLLGSNKLSKRALRTEEVSGGITALCAYMIRFTDAVESGRLDQLSLPTKAVERKSNTHVDAREIFQAWLLKGEKPHSQATFRVPGNEAKRGNSRNLVLRSA